MRPLRKSYGNARRTYGFRRNRAFPEVLTKLKVAGSRPVSVGAFDLAFLLGAWGPNPDHPADLNDDDIIYATDLALLLGAWGPCP